MNNQPNPSLTPIQINALIDHALTNIDYTLIEASTGLSDLPDRPLIRHLAQTVSETLFNVVLTNNFQPHQVRPDSALSPLILQILLQDSITTTPEQELELFLINYEDMDYALPHLALSSPKIQDIPLYVSVYILDQFQTAIATQLIRHFEDAFLGQSPFTSEHSKKLHDIPQLLWDEDRVEYVEI